MLLTQQRRDHFNVFKMSIRRPTLQRDVLKILKQYKCLMMKGCPGVGLYYFSALFAFNRPSKAILTYIFLL